ncbi:MAG: NADH-quinone oxidoreductase subunit J [Cytophagales bacterium]
MEINLINVTISILSILTVLSSMLVLIEKTLIKASLALISCLILIAGIYLIKDADFLAASQLVVYVGGILVLIVMGMIMTKTIKNNTLKTVNYKSILFVVLILILGLLFWRHLNNIDLSITSTTQIQIDKTKEIGRSFSTSLVLIFELIAFLLTLALLSSFSVVGDLIKKN